MQNMQNMQNMQSTQNPQSATTWTYNAVFITEERHTWVTKSGVATPLQADSLAALLNLLGGQGWELTALTPALGPQVGYPITEFWAIFKRPQA